MMRLRLILALGAITVLLAAAIVLPGIQTAAAVDPPQEAALDPQGSAYEINIAASGQLLISEYILGEIWRVDPLTADFTVFGGLSAPSDARQADNGMIWWADGEVGRFGRLDPASGEAWWWAAPGATGLLGTQIDAAGNFWTAALAEPLLFRFEPDAGRLCTYTVPDDGRAGYLVVVDGAIWTGDDGNGRLLRLDPQTDKLDYWELPEGSAPLGLAADDAGLIWYADGGNGVLGRFEVQSGQLSTFDPPTGQLLTAVAVRGNTPWYSEQRDGAVGRLLPPAAESTTTTLTAANVAAQVQCAVVETQEPEELPIRTGQLSWADMEYPLLADEDGWRIFDLPQDAYPWGVAADADFTWFVDAERQVLGRIPAEAPAAVTACKLQDLDGDLATTGDRVPVAGWRIYLQVEGKRAGNGLPTGDDGCARWTDLVPGLTYGAEEVLPWGWLALTETSHYFGLADPGAEFQHTFINALDPEANSAIFLPIIFGLQ